MQKCRKMDDLQNFPVQYLIQDMKMEYKTVWLKNTPKCFTWTIAKKLYLFFSKFKTRIWISILCIGPKIMAIPKNELFFVRKNAEDKLKEKHSACNFS